MSEIGLLGEPMVVDVDFSQAEPSIFITMINWIDINFYWIASDRVRTNYTVCHNLADCSGRRIWYRLTGLSCDADHELVDPGKIP
jgi:hypothetical protein